MTQKKLKVMAYTESSLLSSGYGTYTLNLLKQLHSLDKYDIAEVATYLTPDNPRIKELNWKVYPVQPVTEPHLTEYRSEPENQFGRFILDAAALDFRPDVIISWRDYYMDDYLEISPARRYFKHVYLAPVDSAPQRSEWLDSFAKPDVVLTYSDWGLEVLNKEGCGNIKTLESAFCGVDESAFKPLDQRECRKTLGVPEDAFVIGTVMRAQPRKLFKNLCESFAKFLEIAPPIIASKSYMYFHSCYPDISWSFPELIREFGVGNRIFFSYLCRNCRLVTASLFRGGRAICPGCGKNELYMPNVQHGTCPRTLGMIYNTFDLYTQYACAEGLGIGQIEAAACGVPVCAVDATAMIDIVRKVNGFPIKVKAMFRDIGSGADRAHPDDDDFIRIMLEFARLPAEMRLKYRNAAVAGFKKWFTWPRVASVWEKAIDMAGPSLNWDSPPDIHEIPTSYPENLTNEQFIRWGFDCCAKRSDLRTCKYALNFIRGLNNGVYPTGEACTRENIFPQFQALGETKNLFERKRCSIG